MILINPLIDVHFAHWIGEMSARLLTVHMQREKHPYIKVELEISSTGIGGELKVSDIYAIKIKLGVNVRMSIYLHTNI